MPAGIGRSVRVRSAPSFAAVDLHLREAVAAALGDQDVGGAPALGGAVDGVERCRRDRDRDTTAASIRSGEKATTAPSLGLDAGPAGQVGREDRTRERDVGHGFRERVGDDRRLDPARERPTLFSVVAQLEPAGVAHGPGEPLGARPVVEVGDGPRSELPRQLAGGAPELGLFGRVSDIHGEPRRGCSRDSAAQGNV